MCRIILSKDISTYYLYEKKAKRTMSLSNVLVYSFVIIHYIVEKSNFVAIIYKQKRHINDCYKIHGKQGIKMPKKDEYVRFKNYEGKIKLSFMICADFESVLAP